MENYRKAYEERLKDHSNLEDAGRQIAAMHFGGITIECLLKALLVEIHQITDWNSQATPQKHSVSNPGHSLAWAIQCSPKLMQRFIAINKSQSYRLHKALRLLEKPSCSFIDLRYEYQTPNNFDYQKWKKAFDDIHKWLLEQENQLCSKRRS